MAALITNPVLITVPSLQGKGGVASFYKALFPQFAEGGVIPLEIGSSRNIGYLLHPIVDQVRFRLAVKRVKPPLIHLNPSLNAKSFFRDGIFAWHAKKMGYPLLVFWHGWDKDFESKVAERYLGFFNRTFGQADCFIVLAAEFERKLEEWGVKVPIYRGTTTVQESLLAGIEVEKKWVDPVKSSVKILFLARLERAKGVFETVQAVKLLIDKKCPVCLTVSGDGEIRQELEEYTRSLNLTPQQVEFTGDIRGGSKTRIFAEHHIYCLPTFYGEGMPNSVLEAMAFGMPVVTRHVGGLADFFKDGEMGYIVHGKRPEEIADCLEKIIGDQNRMAKIGKYNARYAKEHFMASAVAKRLMRIYKEL